MVYRYEELDSLRGTAAIIVLISHTLFMFSTLEQDIKSSVPFLSFIWNGHSAVVLFFILSGFVLTLPFEKKVKFSYPKYVIKRYCRIYLPYLIILSVAIILKGILVNRVGTIPNLQQWAFWSKETSILSLVQHIFFLVEFDADAFLMVIWSLVHEMRISLIFPFVVLLLLRVNWKYSLSIAMLSSVLSFTLIKLIPTKFDLAISTNYFISLHYLSMFIIGSIIAINRNVIINWAKSSKLTIAIGVASFFLFNYPEVPYMVIGKLFGNIDYLLFQMFMDWIILAGGAGIVICSLSLRSFSKLLLYRPVNFLGQISYSIYLVHPVILITLAHSLYGFLPTPVILLIAFVLTFIIAAVCYKYIEQPSVNLGKRLTGIKKMDKSIQKEASA
ncbi:acyltransferase [Mesobacillus foraminis]|uniref:acyltransferase family protein n=1 Tax=Mesobacillus foraminis TaxID=279826 RepID=UPI001BE940BF|nr:acyltransferase [Mesobacillus foraminis]MBT2758399.1 acyltransferase [Mesobacillus foraminis]